MNFIHEIVHFIEEHLLTSVSADFLCELQGQILKLHKKALKTTNPFDNLLTSLLMKIFKVPEETEK